MGNSDGSNDNLRGPNIKKKQTCKMCKGEGVVKKGERELKCPQCKGTGVR